jgi:hypothetical protein
VTGIEAGQVTPKASRCKATFRSKEKALFLALRVLLAVQREGGLAGPPSRLLG